MALLKDLGRALSNDEVWHAWDALKKAGVEVVVEVQGQPDAFAAEGYLGQYLLIVPSSRLVAVRMAEEVDDLPWDAFEYREFVDDARALVRD